MTRKRLTTLAVLLIVITVVLLAPLLYANLRYLPAIYAIDFAPDSPVAIVFGAAVNADGTATAVLRKRVITAVTLYQQGKVKTLIMSGDERHNDEPAVMQQLAESLGVPAAAISQDGLGYRTFDTCQRAYEEFGVRQAILVTTRYHLPRSLFTCDSLGIAVIGVYADEDSVPLSESIWRYGREIGAMWGAILDLLRR
ncbi:MAG: YdcF family protein [Anaerolineae bacterium]|nr:YdcF family protein [Anaerolineae bacterium]